MKKLQRLFVDMDGTLVEWSTTASFREVCLPGYFAYRPAQENVIKAIKELNKYFDVYILSSVLQDDHSISDKDDWLDKYLPQISIEKRLYVPYGESKSEYIDDPLENDILLDDYSENLRAWHGIGIKLMNGINGKHGTWRGYQVHKEMYPEIISHTIKSVSTR